MLGELAKERKKKLAEEFNKAESRNNTFRPKIDNRSSQIA